MLNKLLSDIRRYGMVSSGERVICAVSGGADSVALLFGMYLLKEKLRIDLEAAHYNHGLRGEESDRDQEFVTALCQRYEIPLHIGSGHVTAGKKGLEAAARDARYGFLEKLPGKIATAHTADDNAETVLMHLIRGTGLKGLGGIAPVNGKLIRPMLNVTREEVLSFLEEYHLGYMEDSSNGTDRFLRNRIRHHVMPLLKKENPQVAPNLSAMAMRLRQDEEVLSDLCSPVQDVTVLRQMAAPMRSRSLAALLEQWGVREPEAEHIALAEKLVFSENPSARASFPGGVMVTRIYDQLERLTCKALPETLALDCPGEITLQDVGLRVICSPAQNLSDRPDCFCVMPLGKISLRRRLSGDVMRLSGGTKSLKKLFVDRKIPAPRRQLIPVIADETGVLGVYGIGANKDRLAKSLPAIEIRFERL